MEVQVVYDASHPRGRSAAGTKSIRGSGEPRSRRRLLILVGTTSLAVSGVMYYATWWRVDPWVFLTFMLRTPLTAVVAQSTPREIREYDRGSGLWPIEGISSVGIKDSLGINPQRDQPKPAAPGDSIDLEEAARVMFRITPDRAESEDPGAQGAASVALSAPAVLIPAVAYGWLTLATIGYCALALAAGTIISRSGSTTLRLLGLLFAILVAAAMGYGGYRVWDQYHMGYQPWHLRMGMGLLALLAAAIGAAVQRWPAGLARLAGASLLIAAIASVVGLVLWHQAGAIEAQYVAPVFLALVFVAHSFWGWVLLLMSRRL